MIEDLKKNLPDAGSVDIRTIPPLTLAYIGDSVMDLMIRSYFATTTHETVSKINNKAIKIVNAAAQAKILGVIDDILTEEEKDAVRRGRNAKSQTVPKNQNVNDYRLATGLEALFGWLFLMNRQERICELLAYSKDLWITV